MWCKLEAMPRSPKDPSENSAPGPESESLLGVQIGALNMDRALAWIVRWVAERQPRYVCVAAAHSLMDCRRDPELRAIFNDAAAVTPDGMPLVWYLRLKGHRHVSRVYGPDLMLALCEHGQTKGLRHFFYGGTAEKLGRLGQRLQERYPSLEIAGTFAPPFRPLNEDEELELQEAVRETRPDVLWVGIGSPKQERWMAEHVGKLDVPVMIGVGAAFDIHAGAKPQAPRWMQRVGMEWFFRLLTEPGRAWRRYRSYPLFALLLLAELAGGADD